MPLPVETRLHKADKLSAFTVSVCSVHPHGPGLCRSQRAYISFWSSIDPRSRDLPVNHQIVGSNTFTINT